MSPRPRSTGVASSSDIVGWDDFIREWWAAFLRVQVDRDGNVPGFAKHEGRMKLDERELTWSRARACWEQCRVSREPKRLAIGEAMSQLRKDLVTMSRMRKPDQFSCDPPYPVPDFPE